MLRKQVKEPVKNFRTVGAFGIVAAMSHRRGSAKIPSSHQYLVIVVLMCFGSLLFITCKQHLPSSSKKWLATTPLAPELAGAPESAGVVPPSEAESAGAGGEIRNYLDLIGVLPDQMLMREIIELLRADVLLGHHDAVNPLPDLDAALSRAADDHRRLILTFCNLGYADFVASGLRHVRQVTLVVALDGECCRFSALLLNAATHERKKPGDYRTCC